MKRCDVMGNILKTLTTVQLDEAPMPISKMDWKLLPVTARISDLPRMLWDRLNKKC